MAVTVGVRSAGDDSTTADTGSSFQFSLISAARGADAAKLSPQVVSYNLVPQPALTDPLPEHRAPVGTPQATPLPTPVAPPQALVSRPVYIKPVPIVGSGQLKWPVPGGVITQYYSAWHLAIDIAAPAGSSVVAAGAGTVTWAGWRSNGGGLVISIDHGNGIVTVYNHLGAMFVGVGATVAAGQGIAAVGCTGVCTGPHVHFEVIVNGVIVNPLRYL